MHTPERKVTHTCPVHATRRRTTAVSKTALLDLRVEPELIQRIDRWRARQRVPPSRTATVTRILEDFLDREEGMASLRARYEREQEARQAADG